MLITRVEASSGSLSSGTLLIIAASVFLILLVALVMIVRRKKQKTMAKQITEKTELATGKLETCLDELERCIEISKNEESKRLSNDWAIELNELNQKNVQINLEVDKLAEKNTVGKYKVYMRQADSINLQLETLLENTDKLFAKLKNYTDLELENAQIALEIKVQLKELKNRFDKKLKMYEVYEGSFFSEATKVTTALIRFEELQKLGEYSDARLFLKEAANVLENLEINFISCTSLIDAITTLEKNVKQIQEKKQEILANKFEAELSGIGELTEIIDQLEENKQQIFEFDFGVQNTEVDIAVFEQPLNEINSKCHIYAIEINRQFDVVQEIIQMREENHELLEISDEFVKVAVLEKREISKLYELPEIKQIKRLDDEIDVYYQFKKDYEVLLEVCALQEEEIDKLKERLEKSNLYLNRLLVNIKGAFEDLQAIRTDELEAMEILETMKKEFMYLELYCNYSMHIDDSSMLLSLKKKEARDKISHLEEELERTPLNITAVRHASQAIAVIMGELTQEIEDEIKHKIAARKLIHYFNQHLKNDEMRKISSHLNGLLSDKDYRQVIKEMYQLLIDGSSQGEKIYRGIVKSVEIEEFKIYKENHVLF